MAYTQRRRPRQHIVATINRDIDPQDGTGTLKKGTRVTLVNATDSQATVTYDGMAGTGTWCTGVMVSKKDLDWDHPTDAEVRL